MKIAAIVLAISALGSTPVLAGEAPGNCYAPKDAAQVFTRDKVKHFDALAASSGEVRRQLNLSNRAFGKCFQRHFEREGWPKGGAGILFGMRVTPEGKVAQVSVLDFENINDGMLIACIGRKMCEWEFPADPVNGEKLIAVPHTFGAQPVEFRR
jgi:hypothetical protein